MDYKEKYEQALERAKVINPGTADYEVAVKIFPSLKESEDEKIRKDIIIYLQYSMAFDKSFLDKKYNWSQKDCSKWIDWLEKQDMKESKKTSIWKHWNNGIAGNGEGKLIYLIKNGVNYSLSSCLGFECDYILLSDLDKLMLQEKQGEQKPAWSEEDEKMIELLIAILEVNHPNEKFKVNPQNTLNMKYMSTEEIVAWLKSLRERIIDVI